MHPEGSPPLALLPVLAQSAWGRAKLGWHRFHPSALVPQGTNQPALCPWGSYKAPILLKPSPRWLGTSHVTVLNF